MIAALYTLGMRVVFRQEDMRRREGFGASGRGGRGPQSSDGARDPHRMDRLCHGRGRHFRGGTDFSHVGE